MKITIFCAEKEMMQEEADTVLKQIIIYEWLLKRNVCIITSVW